MRLHLSPTRHARAQVSTLREHFLKLGAQVIVSVRRIVLHSPQAFPLSSSRLGLGRLPAKHLVLLPGLDGTGELFADFIAALPESWTTATVAYPSDRFLS